MEPPDSELRTCTQCGTSMDKTLKFCMVCGAKPEEPKSCVSCHALVDKNLKFCMKCGTRVELPPEVEKTCTSCGVSLDKSLKFCMVCGTKAPVDFKASSLPAAAIVKAKVPARAAPRRITETASPPAAASSVALAAISSVASTATPSPKPRPVKPPPSKPAPSNNNNALTSSPSMSSFSSIMSSMCNEDGDIITSKQPVSHASASPLDTDLPSPSTTTSTASVPSPLDRAPSRPAPKKRLPPPPVITSTTTFTTLTTTPILSPTFASPSSPDSYLPPPPPEPETLPLPPSDEAHDLSSSISPLPSPSREYSPSESKDARTPTHKRDTTRSPSRDRNRAASNDKHRDTRSPSSGDRNRDTRSESNRSDSNNSKVRSESTASKSDSLTKDLAETLIDKTRDSRSPTLEMHLREIRSVTVERKSAVGAYGFASFDAAVLPRGSVIASNERNSSSEAPPSPSAAAVSVAAVAAAAAGTPTANTVATIVSVAVDADGDSNHHKRAESEDSAGGGGGLTSSPTMGGGKSLREKRLAMQRTLKARGTLKATENTPMVVETLVLNDAFIPVPSINSTEELMQYVEDKFAHGKLVKDPDSLGQFFSFLHRPKASGFLHFCPPEHVPRVFHHCIMGAFREKSVLQELVRGGQWKQWLVPLLTENTELLDYVIVVIVAAYDYVFHTFSEELSGVPIDKDVAAKERSKDAAKEAARALRRLEAAKKTELTPPMAMQDSRMVDDVVTRPKSLSVAIRSSASNMNLGLSSDENCELLPLGLARDKDLCYSDFLADALSYVTMCTKAEYTFQLLASLMLKLGSWTAVKPPWALPIVAMVEWQNLFSMLEVLEDVTFFQENIRNATVGTARRPTKEFVMPRLDLKSMPAVEACIALLQKLKVSEISEVPDPDATVFKLQQHYTRVGVQELSFFREVRDFFLLHGARVNRLIVMADDASDQIAAKFVSTLTSRKRNYGGKAQVKLKVSQYVTRCEHALKLGEKRGTDAEAKSSERASISEGTVELGWYANSYKDKASTTPASETRNLFARTTSDFKRDRAPSDNSLGGSFSNGDNNLVAPPSPESVVRSLPLLED